MKAEKKKELEPERQTAIQRPEVVVVERSAHDMIDPLVIIEQRNKLLERVLAYAIAATHPGQWVDQNGKPWPTAPAAEVMARRCAVSIKGVRRQRSDSSDDKGHYYLYTVEATASLPGEFDSIEAIGTCSSRDQFLGTETKAGRQLSEVDEGNILKAAYSNMVVNAVTRLLGVRNLTWERLEGLGIERDGVSKVEYQSGGRGGGKLPVEEEPLRFGAGKGKLIRELSDELLQTYRQAFQRDANSTDPEKQNFKGKAAKQLAAAEAEIAARAAKKSGDTPKAAPAAESAWQRILGMGTLAGMNLDQVKKLVKEKTKKANANALVEADVAAMRQAIEEWKQGEQDIPF